GPGTARPLVNPSDSGIGYRVDLKRAGQCPAPTVDFRVDSRMRRSLPFLLLAACAGEPAVEVSTWAALPAVDTLIVPGAHVTSDAAPRSDGTWVVMALDEMQVHVLDFVNGQVSEHPGINRDEVPGMVSMMSSGDTIFIGDFGLRRVTAW